jgi:hypothetical protein
MYTMMDDILEYGQLNYRAGFFAGLLTGFIGTNIFVYLSGTH